MLLTLLLPLNFCYLCQASDWTWYNQESPAETELACLLISSKLLFLTENYCIVRNSILTMSVPFCVYLSTSVCLEKYIIKIVLHL